MNPRRRFAGHTLCLTFSFMLALVLTSCISFSMDAETDLADFGLNGPSPLQSINSVYVFVEDAKDLRVDKKVILDSTALKSGPRVVDSGDASITLRKAIIAELQRCGVSVVNDRSSDRNTVIISPTLKELRAEGVTEEIFGAKHFILTLAVDLNVFRGDEHNVVASKSYTETAEIKGMGRIDNTVLFLFGQALRKVVKDFTWDEEIVSALKS